MTTLSMEATFIVTGIGVFLAGAALGLLICWIFEKDNKED